MNGTAHVARVAGDGVSVAIVAGTIAGVLPSIAAALAIVWYCVLLYDRIKRGGPRE